MSPALIAVVVAGLALVGLERLRPAARLPRVRAWWPRVALLNGVQLGAVLLAGATWDRWLRGGAALELGAALPAWGQGLVAYVVASFVYYGWHRARHAWRPLWLLCHQLHHSPRRLEVAMAFYKHPVEVLANALLSSAIAYPLLGCDASGAAIYTLLAGGAELFYHLNVRTPYWVGFLIQRPEAHRLHHERGVHARNYADLPVIDMLFGTFENPRRVETDCGFEAWREDRLEDMLAGRDVHAPDAAGRAPLRLLPRWLGAARAGEARRAA